MFPLDTNDFVRTKLTHSLETSCIAKKIGSTIIENLKEKVDHSSKKYKNIEKYFNEIEVIPDILLCTGLLHDMGNPPFGHFGEEIIRNWFKVNLAREDLEFKGKQIKTLLIK